MHRAGGGKYSGRLADQGAACPLRSGGVEKILERCGHVAEAGGAAQRKPDAVVQVLARRVRGAFVGLGRLGHLGHRCHRRHLAQARAHAGNFLDATCDQPCQLGGVAAAAVVEHQDVMAHGHWGIQWQCASVPGDDTLSPFAAMADALSPPSRQPMKDPSMAFRFDRARVLSFGRFLWHRFVDDKCFETAGALSYTPLVSLVPLTVAVLTVFAAFPMFADARVTLINFVFQNFVPAAGETVQKALLDFASNARKLTGISILV